jgi:hypothetical protein
MGMETQNSEQKPEENDIIIDAYGKYFDLIEDPPAEKDYMYDYKDAALAWIYDGNRIMIPAYGNDKLYIDLLPIYLNDILIFAEEFAEYSNEVSPAAVALYDIVLRELVRFDGWICYDIAGNRILYPDDSDFDLAPDVDKIKEYVKKFREMSRDSIIAFCVSLSDDP